MKLRKRDNCYYLSTYGDNGYTDWAYIYLRKHFELSYELCGYFDNRPEINICLFFFHMTIKLPFYNKWTDECDPPKWGIAIHNNTFWLYKGGKGNMKGGNKWWTWDIPFFTHKFFRRSILMNNDTWLHELPGKSREFWKDEFKLNRKSWIYSYTDRYDGEVIPTTIMVRQMEWRPKWLTWTRLFASISTMIDVEFDKEIGKRKGSWKGGTIGCDYEIRKGESPLDCLKRMEKEREF